MARPFEGYQKMIMLSDLEGGALSDESAEESTDRATSPLESTHTSIGHPFERLSLRGGLLLVALTRAAHVIHDGITQQEDVNGRNRAAAEQILNTLYDLLDPAPDWEHTLNVAEVEAHRLNPARIVLSGNNGRTLRLDLLTTGEKPTAVLRDSALKGQGAEKTLATYRRRGSEQLLRTISLKFYPSQETKYGQATAEMRLILDPLNDTEPQVSLHIDQAQLGPKVPLLECSSHPAFYRYFKAGSPDQPLEVLDAIIMDLIIASQKALATGKKAHAQSIEKRRKEIRARFQPRKRLVKGRGAWA